jgi:2-amino-4-hydroxy-6-hydroxymethyldihydropteridine diphosphokinase
LKPHAFRAAIGLGANLGEARQTLLNALAELAGLPWTQVDAVSLFYKTAPVGASGPDYVNAVALLSTALGPLELLHALQGLEWAHGRERPYRHAPRTLDLDILWYERLVRHTAELTLPHPRWRARAFVLEPLSEVLSSGATWPAEGATNWGWPLPDATERAALAAQQGIERLV